MVSMRFEDGGKKVGKLEKLGKSTKTGSKIRFMPDQADLLDDRIQCRLDLRTGAGKRVPIEEYYDGCERRTFRQDGNVPL